MMAIAPRDCELCLYQDGHSTACPVATGNWSKYNLGRSAAHFFPKLDPAFDLVHPAFLLGWFVYQEQHGKSYP